MLRCFLFIFIFIFSCNCFAGAPLTLSLQEAIYLAVRENPNVQLVQLAHVLSKFNLSIQHWQFQPHYAFNASASLTRTEADGDISHAQTYSVQPTVSLLTPIGTRITLGSTLTANLNKGNFHPGISAQIVQPLMRGFGKAVVEAALYNAMDGELIARLNIESSIRATVTNVINAYLDVVAAETTLNVDQDALNRARVAVEQTKLFIKGGHKAGVELVTVNADVANAETTLENDKNNLAQVRFALLTAIGMDPNTEVHFTSLNIPALIKKYHTPSLDETKLLSLENDTQYQIDQITLHGMYARNLMIAEDNTRPILDLTANGAFGNGSGPGRNAGINSILNGYNQTQGVMLNLTIPIDDRLAKQAVADAHIALQEANIALRQEKWQKQTNAITGWHTIGSSERAYHFADLAEKLQQQTYTITAKKYQYGLIDSVELQSVQQQLIQREQALVVARINYLKSLVGIDQLIGNTLHTWHVEVRYD